jgi:class 3 adenylate cyclase/tetratricopeptide (TPR) repeat protein
MTTIRQWLDSLGLAQYAEAFEKNDIYLELLPELNDEFLQAVGVTSVGHRMKILKAVREEEPSPGAAIAEQTEERPSQPATKPEAERRQLTVMFCDLVGSVELGERMDVEDYRDLLARFRNSVVEAVERSQGFVARHQGDGVLVYFGYPQAQENDAERAVKAGLEVVRSVAALEHPYDATLAARVGVATGLAVVGDALSTGSTGELAAFGPTPNLAARLQGKAEPGTVIASETTARLISGLLETEALPAFDLRGIATPVTAFRVLEQERAETRSEALESVGLSPLVGRQGELVLILDRWRQVREGTGQAVLVSAEPGVGKTRIVHEVRERLRGHVRPITLYCSPYHIGSALHPVIEALGRILEFRQEDAPENRFRALEHWLRNVRAEEGSLPLLSTLLSLPLSEGHEPVTLPPDELKRQTLETLSNLIQVLAEVQPVMLVAEDLHWVDPTTLEWLELIVERVRDTRVLAMLTCRPEFSSPWSGQPHLTSLTLNHLTPVECRRLAESIAMEGALPEALLTRIVERTDGVPLFVEELSRTVLEAADDEINDQSVPETLRDALTARLDRLGSAKAVAQLAAVIGRQFRLDWLEAASPLASAEIHNALDRLVRSGLAYRRGSSVVGYEFKHALVRDTAYDSLLREERERLHGRVAVALVESINQLDAAPELIAFHYSKAGDMEHAVPYWQRAGELAARRDAYEEAAKHYSDALSYLESESEKSRRVLELVVGLSQAMHLVGDQRAAHELLIRYQALPLEIGDARLTARFYSARGFVEAFFGERKAARESLERAVEAAAKTDNDLFTAEAQAYLAGEEVFAEDYRSAMRRAETALLTLARGESIAAGNVAYWAAGTAHLALGNMEQALRVAAQCVAAGRAAKRPSTLSLGAWIHTAVCQEVGEFDEAVATVQEAIEAGLPPFEEALLSPELGKARLEAGDSEAAIPLLEEGLRKARQYRSRQVQLSAALSLVRAYLECGELKKAEALMESARGTSREIESYFGQTRWIAGLVAQSKGENNKAAEHFETAIKDLSARGARPLQARAHLAAASGAHSSGDAGQVTRHLRAASTLYREMKLDHQVRNVEGLAEQYAVQLA